MKGTGRAMTGRSSKRTSKRQPARGDLPLSSVGFEPHLALVAGLEDSTVGVCLADERDLIRYVNAAYRASFLPHFDGTPKDFTTEIVVAIKAGTGIKLDSADPDAFSDIIKARRRDQTGFSQLHGRHAERAVVVGHGHQAVEWLDAGRGAGNLGAETGGVQAP